jgi:hypothetical protein
MSATAIENPTAKAVLAEKKYQNLGLLVSILR